MSLVRTIVLVVVGRSPATLDHFTLTMKTTHRIVGTLWMAICAYFFATLGQGIYESRPDRPGTLAINLFFVLLYLSGAVTSFYVLTGARWARVVLSIVALLTATASVMGLFAFFNSLPFSLVGIAFDIFALASAGVLLFVRKCAVV
jgi:hypothetical protein